MFKKITVFLEQIIEVTEKWAIYMKISMTWKSPFCFTWAEIEYTNGHNVTFSWEYLWYKSLYVT